MTDVEKLFQQQPIAAVREVEARTRREVEEKKQQLRRVVGDSYRDLISSADTIIDISRSCRRLVDLTASLQRGLGELGAGAGGAAVASAEPAAASSYDRLYALGSRIKYLVDTPETIYGCLDGGDYLEAARRYVRAAEAHRLLSAGAAKAVAQRFPLLQHQWPLVKKLRGQVADAAASWLAAAGELGAGQAAAALAALALLKPIDGAEVLKAFLAARRAYIMQCLSAVTAPNAATDLDSLACILSDVAAMVCSTVAQCGELFLPLPGVSATPLLLRALTDSEGAAADLLFDSGREAEAWQAHVEAVRGRLGELSSGGLALECAGWLDGLSSALGALGGGLLGACSGGAGLVQVEGAVRAALDGWAYRLQAGSAPSASLDAAADAARLEEPPPAALSWGDACQWALGRPAPLWPLLFEGPLVDRARQLAARDFESAAEEVERLLGGALQEAAALPPSAPGAFQLGGWADTVELQPLTPPPGLGGSANGKRRRLPRHPRPASGGADGEQAPAQQQWLAGAERVVLRFDERLRGALEGALDACGGGGGGGAPGAPVGDAVGKRALDLEPFVQDRCAEAVERIAASLEARLAALPPEGGGSGGAAAPAATQALLLGRLALGLAGRSAVLPAVLGPLDQWRSALGDRPAAAPATYASGSLGAAATAPPPPSARCKQLQQRLRAVGLAAHGVWADWASAGLAAAFVAELAADHTLAADAPLRAWEETVVGGDGDGGQVDDSGGGGGGLEMRFWLPATPSPAAARLALGACREADRAGGHLLADEPLQLFKWRLAGALLAALGPALGPALDDGGASPAAAGSSLPRVRLSEKGVLQLLLDTRFLLDLLATAAAPPLADGAAAAPGGAAALADRRRAAAALEAALAGRLDPIDWATYEPYLNANKERAAARRQVLFGVLLRGSRPRPGGGGGMDVATGAAAESNTLRLAAAGPRFSYLPVSAPSALLRQASTLPGLQLGRSWSQGELSRAASGVPAAAAASGAAAGTGAAESAAAYSFASLLAAPRPRGGSGGGSGGAAPGASAAAVGAGVSAAATKLVGSLQGLLGDKAADVAAWSEMGGGGLLSSLTRSFNK